MSDPSSWDIIKVILAPAFGILGGWITSSLKTTNRVSTLEKDLKGLTDKQKEDLAELKKEHKEKLETLRQGFALTIENQKNNLEEKVDELKEDLNALEKSFHDYTRASHHDFTNNEEFRRFTEEWQKQCHNIQRTLGQIEGMYRRETLILSRQPPQDSDPLPESAGSPRARR